MKRLEHYLPVGKQRLRCGYTTGTCAAAASRAAAELLLTGTAPASVLVETPVGIPVEVEVEQAYLTEESACCAVRKDAGDDPDVTDGLLVMSEVRRQKRGWTIQGGEGVGRVTRPGLDQPPGESAINSVPRRMMTEQLRSAAEEAGYTGGLCVTISIPEGRALAEKTFNPRLGIEGGLSILGTTGIVSPMSEAALVNTLRTELDQRRAEGVRDLLLSPGSYGAAFCRTALGLELKPSVQCSNYIGEALDHAALLGFRSLLLVGHVGKLVKCAAGVMNTHSRVADARLETLAAHAAVNGASRENVAYIMASATTDAALELLQKVGLLDATMDSVTRALGCQLRRRAGEHLRVEAVVFSNRFGLLGQTDGALELLELHRGRD